MDIISGLVINVLEEGFIYGIMAVGVYITYSAVSYTHLDVYKRQVHHYVPAIHGVG